MFHGKPIIAYSIEAALESGLFSPRCVFVSTEDDEIGHIAERYGATWWPREQRLADDFTGTQEVTRDVLSYLRDVGEEHEHACCLYATAPLVRVRDLVLGLEVMKSTGKYAYVKGWYYWGMVDWFLGCRPLTDGKEIAVESPVDIDTEEDWQRAERLYLAMPKEAA